MLPDAPVVPGLEIQCSYRACDALGGDFYDFITVDPWRLGFVIADVSGHGAPAALVMASAKKALQIFGRGCPSPRETLLSANTSLRPDMPRGMFVTVLYGVLDIRTLRFDFSCAGHPPPLLAADGAVRSEWPNAGGPVLGVLPSELLAARLQETTIQLRPGDALVLHTDGLTESFAPDGEMLGLARITEMIRHAGSVPASETVARVCAQADNFRGTAPQADDEAIVVLRVLGRAAEPVPLPGAAAETETNLPKAREGLVGRDRDLQEVTAMLGSDATVVTLTGPGGVGKTRLATAVAEQSQAQFPSGVWFCDLTEARDAWGVCRAVAQVLSLQEADARLGERIGNALRGRAATRGGGALLVLDNCEQAAPHVARCVAEWRARAPGTRFLLTSRVATGARGERVRALKPLKVPTGRQKKPQFDEARLAALREVPAVRLFLQRAEEKVPGFALTAENAEAVTGICGALDGIPLALELAAARLGVLTPQQVLARMSERFELLRNRQGHGHHATLETAVAWSWDLLPDHEKAVLAELSVFRGGFFVEVAQQVVSAAEGAADLLDNIESLAAQSLLTHEDVPGLPGERRFVLYESVRLFAQRRLHELGRADTVRARWRSALVDYAVRWWQRRMSPRAREARARIELEVDGLLEIAREGASVEQSAWAAVTAAMVAQRASSDSTFDELLRGFQRAAQPESELYAWLTISAVETAIRNAPAEAEKELAALTPAGPARWHVLLARIRAAQIQGRQPEVEALARQMLELPGLTPLQKAVAQDRLGNCMYKAGDLSGSLKLYEEALKVAREQHDAALEATVLAHIGSAHRMMGALDRSEQALREAVRICQVEKHPGMEASWLGNLGITVADTGQHRQAESCLLRAVTLSRESGSLATEAAHLRNLAYVYHKQDRLEEALSATEQALQLERELGNEHGIAFALSNIAVLRREMGDDSGALQSFEDALRSFRSRGDTHAAVSQMMHIGITHAQQWRRNHDQRSLASAIEVLEDALRELREHKYSRMLELETELARCLADKGDAAQARVLAQGVVDEAARRGGSAPNRNAEVAQKLLEQLGPG
ncbi:MAG: SpoIIE family protein phosphatase [Planctomycetes bacterium]|nr:SpoIIE family protein phosphatase [Planctomycetota bacterium]